MQPVPPRLYLPWRPLRGAQCVDFCRLSGSPLHERLIYIGGPQAVVKAFFGTPPARGACPDSTYEKGRAGGVCCRTRGFGRDPFGRDVFSPLQGAPLCTSTCLARISNNDKGTLRTGKTEGASQLLECGGPPPLCFFGHWSLQRKAKRRRATALQRVAKHIPGLSRGEEEPGVLAARFSAASRGLQPFPAGIRICALVKTWTGFFLDTRASGRASCVSELSGDVTQRLSPFHRVFCIKKRARASRFQPRTGG